MSRFIHLKNFGVGKLIATNAVFQNILEMTVADEDESFDGVCEQAHKLKTAEIYTWSEIWGQILWKNALPAGLIHLGLVASLIIYGFGMYSVPMKIWTIVWIFVVWRATVAGISAGVHRMWTHRSYKATLPLRILLMIFYCTAGLYSMTDWVRDHRVHHKYSETVADPHNAKRGFFFSHLGWLLLKRSDDCVRRGREVDLEDFKADAVVRFERKYGLALRMIFCYIIPTAVPVIFWGETFLHAFLTQCFIRQVVVMHFICCVNSVAHLWGNRPYNRLINPAENLVVSFMTSGEGSHNYHHTFPWDYKAAELPYFNLNTTTLFIDAMAMLGWAYDLRKPSPELVAKVTERLGTKSEIDPAY